MEKLVDICGHLWTDVEGCGHGMDTCGHMLIIQIYITHVQILAYVIHR